MESDFICVYYNLANIYSLFVCLGQLWLQPARTLLQPWVPSWQCTDSVVVVWGLVAPWHVGPRSNQDKTRVPCAARRILNHWTREVHTVTLKGRITLSIFQLGPPGIRERGDFKVGQWKGQHSCVQSSVPIEHLLNARCILATRTLQNRIRQAAVLSQRGSQLSAEGTQPLQSYRAQEVRRRQEGPGFFYILQAVEVC